VATGCICSACTSSLWSLHGPTYRRTAYHHHVDCATGRMFVALGHTCWLSPLIIPQRYHQSWQVLSTATALKFEVISQKVQSSSTYAGPAPSKSWTSDESQQDPRETAVWRSQVLSLAVSHIEVRYLVTAGAVSLNLLLNNLICTVPTH
jgi:hypothetical protein